MMSLIYKKASLHGWLNLEKPGGMSSFHVVRRVRRALSVKKIGHGGTLDPLATGVLPVALGEATKTTYYAMNSMKTYQFGIRWGEARTTDDLEGEISATSDLRPSKKAIYRGLGKFIGQIEQVPPKFSAIKVGGRRAYDLARRNELVNLKPRNVKIFSFNLIDIVSRDRASFSVTCGKGTYVRSLARDLAHWLGTFGHVEWLRRTAVGAFDESRTISLDKIESLGHIAADSSALMPIEAVLDDIPAVALTVDEAQRLKYGQSICLSPVVSRYPFKDIQNGDTVCAMSEGRLLALARIENGAVRPVRVMNF